MGTNYHLIKKCSSCNHEEKLHIGKSSAGWCFALHVYPKSENKQIEEKVIGNFIKRDIVIESLYDWKKWFNNLDWRIFNEYGAELYPSEIIEIITNRYWKVHKEVPELYKSWEDFHNKNQSESGPNNLMRARINERCIGHGEGTWDLMVGEFS